MGCKNLKNNYVVHWSIEYNAFIAETSELAGFMVDGETYIEAVQNVQIAMDGWIETAQVMERAIPAARGKLVYA